MTTAPTPSAARSARAEASGSGGRRTTVSAAPALDRSTPAFAHTKPWRVRQIRRPRSARSSSVLSSRIDLDVARVLAVLGGERARALARLDVRERAHAALGLRDDLVRDGEHVGRAERGVQPRAGGGEQGREVVAGADLRQAREGVEREHRRSGRVCAGEPVEQRARAGRAARARVERRAQRLEVAGRVDVELERGQRARP